MTADSGAPPEQPEPVGKTLSEKRRKLRLSGEKLAEMVGLSQPTISRIERGTGSADPANIAAIAKVLGFEREEIELLCRRTRHINSVKERRRSTSADDVGARMATAREILSFHPVRIPQLLQTSEYARDSCGPERNRFAEVEKVLRGQRILDDPGIEHTVVVAEAVLSRLVGGPFVMLDQLDRLRDDRRPANVSIMVIEQDVPAPDPTMNAFTVVDRDLLIIDSCGVESPCTLDSSVVQHLQIFERLRGVATIDIDQVLDKYCARYVRQAAGRLRPRGASGLAGSSGRGVRMVRQTGVRDAHSAAEPDLSD